MGACVGRHCAPSCRNLLRSGLVSATWLIAEFKRLARTHISFITHIPIHHTPHIQHLQPQVHPQSSTMASQSPPAQLTPDSPVCFKSVHSDISYQSGLLEDARRAVLRDLGSSIPEIPFQTFLNYLAPPRPNFDLEATMRSLKVGPSPALTSLNRWSKF